MYCFYVNNHKEEEEEEKEDNCLLSLLNLLISERARLGSWMPRDTFVERTFEFQQTVYANGAFIN